MARCTNSKRSKAARAASAAAQDNKEALLQLAIAELQDGQHSSADAAAAAHGISGSSIRYRILRRTLKKHAQNKQQLLLLAAETTLVNHICHCSANGFPLNPSDICDYTNLLAHGIPGHSKLVEVGLTWVQCFLQCHPSLKSSWSRCLENAQLTGMDEEGI